jgi:hypothetical protein
LPPELTVAHKRWMGAKARPELRAEPPPLSLEATETGTALNLNRNPNLTLPRAFAE